MTRYFGIHTLDGEWHSLLPRYALLSGRLDGKRVLDIGCGTGIGSSLLLELGAEHVDAIDHRPAVLELARVKHAKQGLDFHVMFWEELGFPDQTFDMVLCLDPTSPVTDLNLLAEIKRVLKPGGEYVCAIERRNIEGVESLLPRYGYTDNAETVEINRSDDRVPQIGNLNENFETVVSVLQQPRYSYVFDYNYEREGSGQRPYAMRKKAEAPDESGLWVGEAPREESAEHTDQRPGRWLGINEHLWEHEGETSNVEMLFCGDAHMPPPTLREVRMPYAGLVERLHSLISDLQIRQHPSQRNPGFGDVVESGGGFSEREQTTQYQALNHWALEKRSRRPGFDPPQPYDFGQQTAREQATHQRSLDQIHEQLEQMTYLYQQVRADMEELFVRTRDELSERDRYIEHLVDTVHRWQHQAYTPVDDQPTGVFHAPSDDELEDFDRETTGIFTKPLAYVQAEDAGESEGASASAASDGSLAEHATHVAEDAGESSPQDAELSESSEPSEASEASEAEHTEPEPTH
ncbi:hypothetical protein DL240_04255 [Lujinxingia litoralis]|uniref:Methyltransferase domain-containing protein n=2 Tax=Lujinxingia litoralis TaxID=2211119 RepID=A0A328CE74_9DELT|nr:hypothetical protein DL240_04255 [Lujinxingia litoralis]